MNAKPNVHGENKVSDDDYRYFEYCYHDSRHCPH
jgi:hypothetical protein